MKLFVRCLITGLLLSFVFRTDSFFIGRGIDPDEGLAQLQGRALCEGFLPYTKYFEHRQPLMYANFAAAQLLFGERVVSCRIWVAILVGLTATFVGLIVRELVRDTRAAIAAMFIIAFCSTATTGTTAVSELLVVPWTSLAVLLALLAPGQRGMRQLSLAVLAGLAIGTASMVKLLAAFDFPVLLCALVIAGKRSGMPISIQIRLALVMLASAFVPTGIVGGIYGLSGHWDVFVYSCFTYNRLYAGAVTFYPALLFTFLKGIALSFIVVWPFALLGLLRGRCPTLGPARCLAVIWFATALASACITRRYFPHYMLMLLPPVGLIAGFGWHSLRHFKPGPRLAGIGLISLVAAVAVVNRGLTFDRQLDEQRDSVILEQRIARHVKPGDVTFFANNDPVLYFVTRTEPATRFLFPTWLGDPNWRAALGIDMEEEFKSVLGRAPSLVVLRPTKGGWEDDAIATFERMMRPKYQPIRRSSRVVFFTPRKAATQPSSSESTVKPGSWKEPGVPAPPSTQGLEARDTRSHRSSHKEATKRRRSRPSPAVYQ
jgi:hypothetical protein